MKKVTMWIAGLLVLACLTACGQTPDPNTETKEPTEAPAIEQTQPPTQPPVSYDPVTELNEETAQLLLDVYNTYANFGVCIMSEGLVEEPLSREILEAAGFSAEQMDSYMVKELSCCRNTQEIQNHVGHYIGAGLMSYTVVLESPCVSYEGKVYSIIGAKGYGGYYLVGKPEQSGPGLASAVVRYDFETTDYIATFELLDGTWKLTDIC